MKSAIWPSALNVISSTPNIVWLPTQA